jgi:hypothetical protein
VAHPSKKVTEIKSLQGSMDRPQVLMDVIFVQEHEASIEIRHQRDIVVVRDINKTFLVSRDLIETV